MIFTYGKKGCQLENLSCKKCRKMGVGFHFWLKKTPTHRRQPGRLGLCGSSETWIRVERYILLPICNSNGFATNCSQILDTAKVIFIVSNKWRQHSSGKPKEQLFRIGLPTRRTNGNNRIAQVLVMTRYSIDT